MISGATTGGSGGSRLRAPARRGRLATSVKKINTPVTPDGDLTVYYYTFTINTILNSVENDVNYVDLRYSCVANSCVSFTHKNIVIQHFL